MTIHPLLQFQLAQTRLHPGATTGIAEVQESRPASSLYYRGLGRGAEGITRAKFETDFQESGTGSCEFALLRFK